MNITFPKLFYPASTFLSTTCHGTYLLATLCSGFKTMQVRNQSTKFFFDQIFFWQKKFLFKIFFTKIFFDQEFFSTKDFFRPKEIFNQKLFSTKFFSYTSQIIKELTLFPFSDQKIFGGQNNFLGLNI